MELRLRQPIARSRVDLKGGGRLDGVSHVVDVRVEAGPVRWKRSGPGILEVEGEVRAYIYYFEKGRRGVSGQGLRIPFASRLDLPAGAPDEVEVYVDELRSEYDYDPVSEEFQHRVAVTLAVAKESAGEKAAEKAAPPQAVGARPAQPPKERPPAEPPGTPRPKAAPPKAAPADSPEAAPPKAGPAMPPGEAAKARDEGKTLVWKAFPPPVEK